MGRFAFHDASKKVNILEKISSMGLAKNAVIMDALFAVQDGWVREDEIFKKDVARGKDCLSLPSELLGWQNTKKDLWFVKPIFEAAGIEVDEEELESEYNRRVKEFFLENKIGDSQDLANLLATGAEFYPPLDGQNEIIEFLKKNAFSGTGIINQIAYKGIGKTEQIRKSILLQMVENPQKEDIERVTDDEKIMVAQMIEVKLKAATKKIEDEKRKNKLVDEILSKHELLEKTNMEIEREKNKRSEKNINNKEKKEIIPKKDDSDNRDDFGE